MDIVIEIACGRFVDLHEASDLGLDYGELGQEDVQHPGYHDNLSDYWKGFQKCGHLEFQNQFLVGVVDIAVPKLFFRLSPFH